MTKISFLNARSLVRKFENIRLDVSLQQSDVIVLGETWIPEKTNKNEDYELNTYEAHLNNCGRGKGIAVFYKQEFQHMGDFNEENISISKMETEGLDIIAIYRSKEGCVSSLINKLQDIINFTKTTLVIGDMNICNRENPKNKLRTYLEENTFKLIVKQATHIAGGQIDQAYLMSKGNYIDEPDIELCPKYYSDHDAICISLKKI